MDFINDIAVGALTPGTNLSTVLALHGVLLLVLLSLIFLLALAATSQPALVPHVLVLLFLSLGLWAAMIWLIGMTGVVPSTSAQTDAAATSTTADEDSDQQQQDKKQS